MDQREQDLRAALAALETDCDRANALCRQLLIQSPDDADALHILGLAECRLRNFRFGLMLLERAHHLAPGNESIARSLAKYRGELTGICGASVAEALAMVAERVKGKADHEIGHGEMMPLYAHAMHNWDTPGGGLLGTIARQVTLLRDNIQVECRSNGERWVLAQLVALKPKRIFDVGARLGEWTGIARTYHPDAEIHGFEISPAVREDYRRRFSDDPGVIAPPLGLLDHVGTVDIHFDADVTYLTSPVYAPTPKAVPIPVPVTTGDAYLQDRQIDAVDFLKVDAEGSDYAVLRGFETSLRAGRIPLIQFEYVIAAMHARRYLKDFYDYLGDLGFVVGKLYRSGVNWGDYDHVEENFLGLNYIACRRERTDIIRLLSFNSLEFCG